MKKRTPPKPRNLAARALRDPLFKARVVKSKKLYSRKGRNHDQA